MRKLEFLLAEAQRRRAGAVVTLGAAGSHHVFATSLYARQLAMETHAVLVPQPDHPHVETQLRADLAIGTHLMPARRFAEARVRAAGLRLRLALAGQRPYEIPAGGSSPLGTLGFVSGAVELVEQIDEGVMPEPAAIYVPCGTTATAAGLALGLAARGLATEVVAVRVTGRALANPRRLSRLVHRTRALLHAHEPHFPDCVRAALDKVRFVHDELGEGYGCPTPAGRTAMEFAADEGLELDPTYTAKAMASLLREAGERYAGQPVLFWNTLNSASMEAFEYRSALRPELRALLR